MGWCYMIIQVFANQHVKIIIAEIQFGRLQPISPAQQLTIVYFVALFLNNTLLVSFLNILRW